MKCCGVLIGGKFGVLILSVDKCINLMGVRGIPAAHGGFESFVANFAPFMRDMGWRVTVYCQESESRAKPRMWEDDWKGIRRIHFETYTRNSLATVEFDMRCIAHVLTQPGIDVVLGYNTAILNAAQRLFGRRIIMNMDGIEWKRQKWGKLAKTWFWINEWIGARLCSVPIADHPEIAAHLKERGCFNSIIIPYGSETVNSAPIEPLVNLGLEPKEYFVSIARIEPENSILEIVEGFVKANICKKLVILGKFEPLKNPYHAKIKAAANEAVRFPGAIYDRSIVNSLRFHCLAYMHGHQVGGTNPSLVEALGAGNAVIAHDNKFNRWTAGEKQLFFGSVESCASAIRKAAGNPQFIEELRDFSRKTHASRFRLFDIHTRYMDVITDQMVKLPVVRGIDASTAP